MGFFQFFGKKKNTNSTTVTVSLQREYEGEGIPPLQGDFAKTIFLNCYLKKAFPEPDKGIVYLTYTCGIKDINAYFKEMCREGYFRKAALAEILESHTIPELTAICEQNGIKKVRGKAKQIDEMVNSNLTVDQLCLERDYYIATEKAVAFVNEHDLFVKIKQHSNMMLDWKEMSALGEPDFYKCAHKVLERRIANADEVWKSCNDYLSLYHLYAEENNREEALKNLLTVLCIDLSGASSMRTIEVLYYTKIHTKKKMLEYSDTIFIFPPKLIAELEDYKDIYNPQYLESLRELDLKWLSSFKAFETIIQSVMNGTYNEADAKALVKKEFAKFL